MSILQTLSRSLRPRSAGKDQDHDNRQAQREHRRGERRGGGGTSPACHPDERSPGEILEELRRLGLAGRHFLPEEYAAALANALGIVIRIVEPDDIEADLYKAIRRRYGRAAGLFYVPERELALVVVPKSFVGIARLMLIYHELSHLAAGHSVPHRRVLFDPERRLERAEPTGEYYELPFIFSRRLPPEPELCERDSDLRARTVCRASIYGVRIYDRAEHFLGLTDHRFPWPTVTPSGLRDLFR